MGKGLIFFCCACTILLFTIINLSVGPIISGRTSIYGYENCAYYSDEYEKVKAGLTEEEKKYDYEWGIDRCKREKAFYNMEYTSFIFDVVIGFVCSLLGLLHLFEVKKELVSKTGLIGLGCGIVGFVLTFIYIIYNGIVYTNYYDNDTIYKRDSDGAFAELKGDKYKCFYFDEKGNEHALIAKYSDLIGKQYNYNKDLQEKYTTQEYQNCLGSPIPCQDNEYYPDLLLTGFKSNGCKYLYYDFRSESTSNEVRNKDKSDRFLTTLILGLFVSLANIGLALFGFLLFRTPDSF